jgi:chemotaxis protein MotB
MAIKKKSLSIPSIWMTVYGDFITNLTLFFILMFATVVMALQQGLSKEELKTFMDQISGAARAEQRVARREELEKTKGTLATIDGVSAVRLTEKELTITLPEAVLFDAGKAQLKEESKTVLAEVGKTLAANKCGRIVVEGHTCDLQPQQTGAADRQRWELALARSTGVGPYRSNRELSAARALQVVRYLSKAGIVPADQLAARAWGAGQPLVPNDSEEHRKKNRRIEIRAMTQQ